MKSTYKRKEYYYFLLFCRCKVVDAVDDCFYYKITKAKCITIYYECVTHFEEYLELYSKARNFVKFFLANYNLILFLLFIIVKVAKLT